MSRGSRMEYPQVLVEVERLVASADKFAGLRRGGFGVAVAELDRHKSSGQMDAEDGVRELQEA